MKYIAVTVLTFITAAVSTGSWAYSSRVNHGQTTYPIWSELSYFERDVLYKRDKALANDPDALLAFYILASGRHSIGDYETVNRRVHAFVEKIRPELERYLDVWQRGELLNRRMHEAFFLKPGISKAPAGYSEDQSRLMGIFETGEFNCISSSLLFIVLAYQLGFEAQGIVLPSHAFVNLILNNERSVEVETTSVSGYDRTHDRNYYERAAANWFSARGLQPSTYEDYLNRQFVSPMALGAINMLNQHTFDDQMSAADRGRLAEIGAYILPNNKALQYRRMGFYKDEIRQMTSAKGWPDLVRFFDTVLDTARADTQRFPNELGLNDASLWMHEIAAMAFAHEKQAERTKDLMQLVHTWPKPEELVARSQWALLHTSSTLLQHYVASDEFIEGLLFLLFSQDLLETSHDWPKTVSWFYSAWSEHRAKNEDWGGAIDVIDEFLSQEYRDLSLFRAYENLGIAYYNWLISYSNAKDWDGARSVLQECKGKYPETDVCKRAESVLIKADQKETNPKNSKEV